MQTSDLLCGTAMMSWRKLSRNHPGDPRRVSGQFPTGDPPQSTKNCHCHTVFSVDKGIPACLSFYRILLEAKKIQNLCSMPQIQFWTHLRVQNRYLIINGFSFQPFDTRIAQLTCLIIFQSSMFMTSIKRAKKLATKC